MENERTMRILIIDDDEDILDLLKYNLEKQSFAVRTLANSTKAFSTACNFNPDLIILDLMMPHPNGIEVCRSLRSDKRFLDTYIFFLTGKSDTYYRHAAMDIGGDDFIDKIIGLRALGYKINSVLKKQFTIRKRVAEVRIGGLTVDRLSETVAFDKQVIELNRYEFELIFFFAQNPERSISAVDIIHNLWGSELYLSDRSIEIFIHNLKRKIGIDIIRRGVGDQYRLSI